MGGARQILPLAALVFTSGCVESCSRRPHITLARLKGTRPESVARFLGSQAPIRLPSFRVERFALFSAKPRVGGGPYVVEESYNLAQF